MIDPSAGQMRCSPGRCCHEPTSSPGRRSGSAAAGRHRCSTTPRGVTAPAHSPTDRKSTRLNSSHVEISYAVFCLKKKLNAKAEDFLPNDLPFLTAYAKAVIA